MSNNFIRLYAWPFAVAALVALCLSAAVPLAAASGTPLVSGTYDVVHKSNLGAQEQVRMRIHLVNHSPSRLAIERMTLLDFAHPDKGGTRPCAVALRAHASADTTLDFTIRRMDYEFWQRGARPRLVLELAGARNARRKAVVRLDRTSPQTSGQEVK